MVANRGKKPRMAAAREASPIVHGEIRIAAQKLQEIQQELDKINDKAFGEISQIEQECIKKQKPVYRRRNEIISEIPDFWLTSFWNHPILEDLLTDEDQKIFDYLDSINVEDFEDPRKGYCIIFNFKANPFFKNKKLTKTINFSGEGTLSSTGTIINWKGGKGRADVGCNDKRRNKRPLPVDSLFSWFSSPDQDKVDVEHDLVADVIKGEIWPNPIGRINDLVEEDDSDEDEDEDEEDDDDEDDEVEEEGGSDENR